MSTYIFEFKLHVFKFSIKNKLIVTFVFLYYDILHSHNRTISSLIRIDTKCFLQLSETHKEWFELIYESISYNFLYDN